ncbi:MAG TPA: M28 family peptidase [Allosphingosinicella sp.]|nr:M28 family peptidase [Allosphingosinicella sp.]
MNKRILLLLAPLLVAAAPPLLPAGQGEAIGAELSGSAALRTVRTLSQHHRMRGSEGYRAAAEAIRDRLRDAGLAEVEIIALPADGRIFYGTQRSRPGWNARFAELWDGRERVASWADQPISLAQDSVSGRAEAELVDVGAGTAESDYQGKEVSGRLVLTSSQPGAIQEMAVGRFGAAGIISWAQNQRTAWWGEDESLVRWGHLDTFAAHPTFAFMVSPARARAWQERLRRGETVRLRAEVDAGQAPSAYLIPTAVIPGRDRQHEIVFSCHLDHPSPGANDNASGCAGELEIARALSHLVGSGALPRPERTIRFLWPAEVEGTIALLNARPEFARRTLATIHLDMIGGNTEITKSILRVHGSPPSLPSFVSEVGFAFGRFVNAQSLLYADTGAAEMPLVEPDGGRRALQAEIGGFNEGSDHQVWAEGSWRIPVIYIADWPDRYIHTQRDLPDNLDPTKMRRAMFIAAGAGWYLASAASFETRAEPSPRTARSGPVYRRLLREGPMDGFGYSWFDDHLARAGLARPRLLARETGPGPSFGYEALNLVDGRRSVGEIRDALAATVGAAPIEEVAEYLDTLARLGVIARVGS